MILPSKGTVTPNHDRYVKLESNDKKWYIKDMVSNFLKLIIVHLYFKIIFKEYITFSLAQLSKAL